MSRDIYKQSNIVRTGACAAFVAIASVLLALMASFVLLALPSAADAKTLAQYDKEISKCQKVVKKKAAAEAEAQRVLDEATTWYYKNVGAEALADIVTGTRDVAQTIEQINCMDAIYASYAEKARAARVAKEEAKAARDKVKKLRDEKRSRAKSLAGAKRVQFPQGGNSPWSSLRYWGSNVAGAGCGLCAYTVVIDVLCGKSYTPTDMLAIRGDWRGMDGYPHDSTGSKSGTHAEFTKSRFDVTMRNISPSVEGLKSALKEKESVAMICSQGAVFKDATGNRRSSGGHFITVIGHDNKGFHVSDSAYDRQHGADVVYSDSEMGAMLSNANSVTIYSN